MDKNICQDGFSQMPRCCDNDPQRCCHQPIFCPPGPPGPAGDKGIPGRAGSPGSLKDTATCYGYAQLAHLIEQLILYYPTSTLYVFLTGLNHWYITGTPYQLFKSAEGTYGGLFILLNGTQYEAIPLNAIAAMQFETGAVYDQRITYLPSPTFPQGCDTNIITAIHDYLPVSTEATIYLGSIAYSIGPVYRNEYGLVVQADSSGNDPSFIPVNHITAILPTSAGSGTKATEAEKAEATTGENERDALSKLRIKAKL